MVAAGCGGPGCSAGPARQQPGRAGESHSRLSKHTDPHMPRTLGVSNSQNLEA